jgi:hypothetical protein
MITNTGKDIVAKYLIGQAPAYASYIALGCGIKPLTTGDNLTPLLAGYSEKQNLNFEMFRVPITSRGYVTDLVDGEEVSKVVFTAELPTEQRYEISEIGVYSAKSNPSATTRDSRILYTFTESENWEYHQETLAVGLGATVTGPLYVNDTNNNLDPTKAPGDVFRATNDNALFNSLARRDRYESCRYLNSSIFMPGDLSWLEVTGSGDTQEMSVKASDPDYHGKHIHLQGVSLDLGKNSPGDELRLALSVISKDELGGEPTRVMVMVEFATSETPSTAESAKFQIDIDGADLADNRYFIAKKKISELIKTNGFSWSDVSIVKIYATAFNIDDLPSSDWYIALDAMRFENVTTINPVYGLTGYSPVMTSDGTTFVKNANTSNLIEFRFGLDVS